MNASSVRVWLALILLGSPLVWAEDPIEDVPAEESLIDTRYRQRTPAEVERLVGRLALYPDVLVALMLPASREPVEIVMAARALRAEPNRTDFEDEPWADSVKRLARYRDALNLLDEDLEWTTELGQVFSVQPADVMDAIQAVRERASRLGYLRNTQHQVVVREARVIRIYPCSWDYVYIPHYDWRRLYVGDYCGPNEVFLSFGAVGFASGYWRGYDCDWTSRRVWISPSVRVVHRNYSHPPAYRHRWTERPEHRENGTRERVRREHRENDSRDHVRREHRENDAREHVRREHRRNEEHRGNDVNRRDDERKSAVARPPESNRREGHRQATSAAPRRADPYENPRLRNTPSSATYSESAPPRTRENRRERDGQTEGPRPRASVPTVDARPAERATSEIKREAPARTTSNDDRPDSSRARDTSSGRSNAFEGRRYDAPQGRSEGGSHQGGGGGRNRH